MRTSSRVVGLLMAVGCAALSYSHCRVAADVQAPSTETVSIPDPWGRVGHDVVLRYVGMQGQGVGCVVLLKRDSDPRLWCR